MYNCHRPTFQHWWSVTMDCFTAKWWESRDFWSIEIRSKLDSDYGIWNLFFRSRCDFFGSQFSRVNSARPDSPRYAMQLPYQWDFSPFEDLRSLRHQTLLGSLLFATILSLKNGWISFYCEHQAATKRSPEGCHWDVARQDSRHWCERVATER